MPRSRWQRGRDSGRASGVTQTGARPRRQPGKRLQVLRQHRTLSYTVKAVPLTHGNLLATARNIVNTYALLPADNTYLVQEFWPDDTGLFPKLSDYPPPCLNRSVILEGINGTESKGYNTTESDAESNDFGNAKSVPSVPAESYCFWFAFWAPESAPESNAFQIIYCIAEIITFGITFCRVVTFGFCSVYCRGSIHSLLKFPILPCATTPPPTLGLRNKVGGKLPICYLSVTGTETPRGLKDQRERETGEGASTPLFTAEERRDIAKPTKKNVKGPREVKKLGESEVESSRADRERSRARDGAEPRDESRECAREGANAAEIDSQIEKRALGIVRITRPREIARVEKRCATKTKAFGHESRGASKCERLGVESEKWRPKPSNPIRVRAGDTESLPRVRSEVEKKDAKNWRAEEPTSNSLIKDSGLHARKGTKWRRRGKVSSYPRASHTSDVGEGYAEDREKGMIEECPGEAALECGDDLHKRIGARP
ncbi:hypothetical protein R3P38DRAFT_3375493 [Favolaschia claudopus]|uniref:Uncharacterized protein n=1 Tax=Favolaschia claudopus TaxID=2862362 RepID=A0AAV9ZIS6_9AGAR